VTKVITSPLTREALGRAALGLGKLGVFAVLSVMSGRIFKTATDEFVAVTYQDWRRVKDIIN
jgi:hypothetical protein